MYYLVLYYLLKTALILFLIPFTLIIVLALFVRLKYEPIKGVCTSRARLDGKVVLVTGANQGIGLETARDLASRGARVVIACRDAAKAAEAIADIIQTTGNDRVEYRPLDLARFSSIRQFAEDFNKSYDQLHILVNNAGCGGLKHKLTEDGIDVVMQVNYFGHFLLTRLLLDKLITSKPSRIVIVSSMLQDFARLKIDDLECVRTKSQFLKYANSKLCDVLWTKALAKKLPEGVTVNVLHPGCVKTDIFRRLSFNKILMVVLDWFFKTPKEGAQTTIHLCVSEELEGVSGKYFVDCKEAAPSYRAFDEELIEKVWSKSIAMTS